MIRGLRSENDGRIRIAHRPLDSSISQSESHDVSAGLSALHVNGDSARRGPGACAARPPTPQSTITDHHSEGSPIPEPSGLASNQLSSVMNPKVWLRLCRVGPILAFCLQTALLLSSGLHAAETDPEPSVQFASHWKEIEHNLGGIQLDGLPKLSYPIGESDDLLRIGLRLELVHHIEVYAYGRPRSAWRTTGLESSLSPGDRGTLIW